MAFVLFYVSTQQCVYATVIRGYSLEERITKAGEILHVKAIDKQGYPSEDGKTAYTDITFRNLDALKGNKQEQEEFILTFEGGPTSSGKYLIVVGIPEFHFGDEYILFVFHPIFCKHCSRKLPKGQVTIQDK